jgi:hemolysin activation/secretion protein
MNKHRPIDRGNSTAKTAARQLAACLGMLVPIAAGAAGPVIPGAGTFLQQVPPSPTLMPPAAQPNLSIRQDRTTPLTGGESFLLNGIQIRGNSLLESAELQALVQSAIGQPTDLAALDALASRITRRYQAKGYPLSRAIVPAQTIDNGIATMLVIEARLDKVTMTNRSQVSDSRLQATLTQLQPGQIIAQDALDRTLLLLSDFPGVTLDASLGPGDKTGTSNLNLTIEPASAWNAYASIDGYGSRYTGRLRLGGGASLANPLHQGDVLNVAALSSGKGLTYGRLAYELPVSGQGTRLVAAYSDLRYELGDTLAPLDSHGSAQVASIWLRHPFWRSNSGNLSAQLQFDELDLRDRTDTSGLKIDRQIASLTASLQGDIQNLVPNASVSTWSLSVSTGRTRFKDAAASAADAATARTAGHWTKWNASASHLQTLSAAMGLHFSLAIQGANKNLDPSQKLAAGGPNSVRAYDVGALSGDSGAFFSSEWRQQLGFWAGSQWQMIGFLESARVRINSTTWVVGSNETTLSGAGVGLNWMGPHKWMGNAYIASRIGSVPSQVSGTAAARLWVSGSRSF